MVTVKKILAGRANVAKARKVRWPVVITNFHCKNFKPECVGLCAFCQRYKPL